MAESTKGETLLEFKPFPAEYTSSLTGSPASATSAGPKNFRSHARTMSMATDSSASHRNNRFSTDTSASSRKSSTFDMRDNLPLSLTTESSTPFATDGNFLTAIAAQERRVLEIKEELEKAELTLDKLKQHWAHHEARRKRDDVRQTVQLQPLQTSFPPEDKGSDPESAKIWMKQEMKRRKTLLSGTKPSSRTVFSGSRHTRALSLLSPKETVQPISQRRIAPRKELPKKQTYGTASILDQEIPNTLIRPATATGSFGELLDHVNQNASLTNAGIDHEALLRQGKKMANNFKDGLWTFWEDLRQATVGEEAVNGPQPKRQTSSQTLRIAKKQSSRNSLRPSSRSSSVSKTSTETKRPSPVQPQKATALPDLADPSFWSEHGMMTQTLAPTLKQKMPSSPQTRSPARRHSVSSNEAWDTWDDSPAQSRTSSVFSESNTVPSTVSGSPRTSTSTNQDVNDVQRKDPIPWPAIKKAGTSTLRRTMSNLMQEWDRLESPPP